MANIEFSNELILLDELIQCITDNCVGKKNGFSYSNSTKEIKIVGTELSENGSVDMFINNKKLTKYDEYHIAIIRFADSYDNADGNKYKPLVKYIHSSLMKGKVIMTPLHYLVPFGFEEEKEETFDEIECCFKPRYRSQYLVYRR